MLSSNLITLRPIQTKDLEKLNKWKNNYDISKNLGSGFQPISIDQQRNWMENMIDLTGNSRRFIIEEYKGQAIGMVGLYDINFVNRNCDFGIYLGEKEYQGKGIGSTATRLIVDYAFNNLNLLKIKLLVNQNNPAIKMYKKLGFTEVGKLKKERFIEGVFIDVILMEKYKDECD